MIAPEDHQDVAIDDDTADIADAEETTHLNQGQERSFSAEETHHEEGEVKAEEENAQIERDDDDMALWAGQPSIKGSTESIRMALLTFSLIGLQ